MTANGDGVNRKDLQSLYNDNPNAKALLDHLASRERNWSTTSVDRLLYKVAGEGTPMSRGDLVHVLQRLDDIGCGRFVPGRHSHPSRFEWSVGLVDVGRAAAGEKVKIEQGQVENADEPPDDLLEHHFRLRKDLDVPFRLPADLNPSEASRLAAFIQTLPFNTTQT
jgi:hypothetical protein